MRKNLGVGLLLNASVDAKGAKEDRKERKGKKRKRSFFSSSLLRVLGISSLRQRSRFRSVPEQALSPSKALQKMNGTKRLLFFMYSA
jgi:hypothetical protein